MFPSGPDLVLAKNPKTTVQEFRGLPQTVQLVGSCLKSISVTLVETVHKRQQFLIGSFKFCKGLEGFLEGAGLEGEWGGLRHLPTPDPRGSGEPYEQ